MKLKVLGSSSKGNCYILENDTEALIIECGVNFGMVKQALNFNLRKVVGCLMTHEHQDHSRAVIDVMDSGINVWASPGTHGAVRVDKLHHRAKWIRPNETTQIGGFKVMAFDVRHDATEPLGFLINHPETGNILFITDSYYVPYTFKNLHNVIVEANYSQEIIREKQERGSLPKFLLDRILESHMSLETCLDLLKANDLTQVNNIVLIHLSDGNSNAGMFQSSVTAATGKTVHIADAGIIINLNKTPF